jgi:hypothetical protein
LNVSAERTDAATAISHARPEQEAMRGLAAAADVERVKGIEPSTFST